MVESRCAITNVVRPCMRYESPCWIISSDSESRLEVASSRIRMRGSARMARAIEILCRCPPESLTPRSPTMVSYFSGKAFGELVHAGDAAGAHDFFFAGVRPGKCHIFANRAVEQERFLQHHAQPGAIRIEAYRAQVDSIHQDFALGRHIKSGNQADDRGFART